MGNLAGLRVPPRDDVFMDFQAQVGVAAAQSFVDALVQKIRGARATDFVDGALYIYIGDITGSLSKDEVIAILYELRAFWSGMQIDPVDAERRYVRNKGKMPTFFRFQMQPE